MLRIQNQDLSRKSFRSVSCAWEQDATSPDQENQPKETSHLKDIQIVSITPLTPGQIPTKQTDQQSILLNLAFDGLSLIFGNSY